MGLFIDSPAPVESFRRTKRPQLVSTLRRGRNAYRPRGVELEFGDEVGEQDRASGPDQALTQHVLQLPDVPGPRMTSEPFHRLRRDLIDVPPELTPKARKK